MASRPYLWLSGVFFLSTCLIPFALVGCTSSSSGAQTASPRDQVIGRPPPPDQDDPFFARALPAEAVPAEAQGRIEAPRLPQEPPEFEVPAPTEEVAATQEASPQTQEPEATSELQEIPVGEARKTCFSCVQICPLDRNGRALCSDDPDDLICGWGSHLQSREASRRAQANCEATLDLARNLPTYSQISGNCPPASCQ